MGVVEAKTLGFWGERKPPRAMGRDGGRALFRGPIDIAWNHLPMPVDEFRRIGVVMNVDDDALPFLEVQQRPRKLSVVEHSRDDMIRRKLHETAGDAKRVVGLFGGLVIGARKMA
jgi:hypothetical protein